VRRYAVVASFILSKDAGGHSDYFTRFMALTILLLIDTRFYGTAAVGRSYIGTFGQQHLTPKQPLH
jgi:hypothetical protein